MASTSGHDTTKIKHEHAIAEKEFDDDDRAPLRRNSMLGMAASTSSLSVTKNRYHGSDINSNNNSNNTNKEPCMCPGCIWLATSDPHAEGRCCCCRAAALAAANAQDDSGSGGGSSLSLMLPTDDAVGAQPRQISSASRSSSDLAATVESMSASGRSGSAGRSDPPPSVRLGYESDDDDYDRSFMSLLPEKLQTHVYR
jgi:hypothetical protein